LTPILSVNSIQWSRSASNAHCRLCRRRGDAENMLLCDGCNKGHHLYCLKPKLIVCWSCLPKLPVFLDISFLRTYMLCFDFYKISYSNRSHKYLHVHWHVEFIKIFTAVFPNLCNYRLPCFVTYCFHLQFINVNRYIKIYVLYLYRKFHKETGFAQNVVRQKRFVLLKGRDVYFLKNQMRMKFRRKRLRMHKSKFISIIWRNLLTVLHIEKCYFNFIQR
jgi:hypothetical protein